MAELLGRYHGHMSFQPAARYPADPRVVFILALSVFSGITALALEAAPASLEDVLPRWGVITWGVLLVLGSAAALIGMIFDNINGIVTEQIGSVAIAATTIFYSALAFYVIGIDALQTVGVILAWGLSCGLRWFQLQSLINHAYRSKIRSEIAEQFRDDVKDGFTADHES